jgi:hypothetical protein
VLNLEVSVAVTAWRLRRPEGPRRPACLYLSLAHAQALLGRHAEALDELAGRSTTPAATASTRAILEDGFVWRARPALAAQCRLAGPAARGERAFRLAGGR